eukprot:snap_masked-scaffold_1-processed-gene-31.18-mRNA-1 protein AED:1.00 eAED:1.00 QI:0/-1/0/0/-1/1/1/0/325
MNQIDRNVKVNLGVSDETKDEYEVFSVLEDILKCVETENTKGNQAADTGLFKSFVQSLNTRIQSVFVSEQEDTRSASSLSPTSSVSTCSSSPEAPLENDPNQQNVASVKQVSWSSRLEEVIFFKPSPGSRLHSLATVLKDINGARDRKKQQRQGAENRLTRRKSSRMLKRYSSSEVVSSPPELLSEKTLSRKRSMSSGSKRSIFRRFFVSSDEKKDIHLSVEEEKNLKKIRFNFVSNKTGKSALIVVNREELQSITEDEVKNKKVLKIISKIKSKLKIKGKESVTFSQFRNDCSSCTPLIDFITDDRLCQNDTKIYVSQTSVSQT